MIWDEMTLRELSEAIHAWADRKGWNVPDRDPIHVLWLIADEAHEAGDLWRRGWALDQVEVDPNTGSPEGIVIDLADALIRILQAAEYWRVHAGMLPIEEAVARKMAYNEKRSYRHGGRRL